MFAGAHIRNMNSQAVICVDLTRLEPNQHAKPAAPAPGGGVPLTEPEVEAMVDRYWKQCSETLSGIAGDGGLVGFGISGRI